MPYTYSYNTVANSITLNTANEKPQPHQDSRSCLRQFRLPIRRHM